MCVCVLQKSVRHESVTTQACDKAADAAGQGTSELKMAGQEMKDKAASTAEDVSVTTFTTSLIFFMSPLFFSPFFSGMSRPVYPHPSRPKVSGGPRPNRQVEPYIFAAQVFPMCSNLLGFDSIPHQSIRLESNSSTTCGQGSSYR